MYAFELGVVRGVRFAEKLTRVRLVKKNLSTLRHQYPWKKRLHHLAFKDAWQG